MKVIVSKCEIPQSIDGVAKVQKASIHPNSPFGGSSGTDFEFFTPPTVIQFETLDPIVFTKTELSRSEKVAFP
jgi:hypothetical protein